MHRACDRRLAALVAAMTDVEAAKAGAQIAAVVSRAALRMFGDAPQRREKERGISGARVAPMPFLARPQDRADVPPRRRREPITRHEALRAGRIDQAIEPSLELGIIDVLV